MRPAIFILAAMHLVAACADFIAPYEPQRQHRDHPWSPPGATAPVRILHRDNGKLHLFGADAPGKVFLLGTDALGRDQFSRLIYGARISLFSGLLAAAISALTGALLGGVAGYFGGFVDRTVMRGSEFFLALPWTYLLLAARAFLPLDANQGLVFAAVLTVLGLIGWARPARLVRGIVLSVKERDYVPAARGFGASAPYLLTRHILPETVPTLGTYVSLAIPQYVLAEATLSFLGLGFSGETASWGALLTPLMQVSAIEQYWWMAIPAGIFAIVFGCYHKVAKRVTGAVTALQSNNGTHSTT